MRTRAGQAHLCADLLLAASLLALASSHAIEFWLHLSYAPFALGVLIHPRARGAALRATAITVVATVHGLRIHGLFTHEIVFEISAMYALAIVVAVTLARRHRSQDDRDRNTARVSAVLHASPLPIVAFDKAGIVLEWNDAATRLFGWSAAEVLGQQNPLRTVDGEHPSSTFRRALTDGGTVTGVEIARNARDGRTLELALSLSEVPGSRDGNSTYVAVYEEIGVRKNAQRELEGAQLRFRQLVERLPLVTYIDEVADNAPNLYTSPQSTDLLGWSPEMWGADPDFFESIVHPDDRERVFAQLAHANARHEPFRSEYRLRDSAGAYVWVRDHSSVIVGADGKALAQGFLLDIREQKQLEQQLLQAQKMEAVGQLAGGIAHDFNNLLTGIGGYAELARMADSDEVRARCLAGIEEAASEAASLTARLLSFSRRHVVAQQALDLNALVRDAALLLGRLLPEDVRLRIDLEPALPCVRADAARLKQVVVNLAVNARDAMPDGGGLTIATAIVDGRVALRVSDTGLGMDEETRAHALEPFFTTKPEGKGTGLGLSVVYGVVEEAGGTLAIDSAPGGGTSVEIQLPATTAAPAALVSAPSAERTGAATGRILVVDDRAIVRDFAATVLSGAGYAVTVAEGGTEALEASESDTFELLVTDVVMPEMTGPEVAAALRAREPHLRVLYMSGYTGDALDRRVLDDETTSFLRKPFGHAELVAKVREALATAV